MKKLLSLALCAALFLGALPAPAQAAAGSQTTIEQVIGALGIITGDASGNLNLRAGVTRAEFAKMLVCASKLKDSVAATGNASPFRDVPYTHWASNYIKTAVTQGWLTGYLDGTYRPDNPVTLAEAATAALKLLGYTSTDFSGTYPYGQMALYSSLNLSDGISGVSSTTMTRQNCMRLFYNLLSADIKDGNQKYIETLGYKVDSDGNPDYTDLLQATMDGPVVLESSVAEAVGFTPETVYRNSAVSSADALQTWDVLYYSASRKTVWAYARRITGIYEAASPNKDSPTAVTIAGTSYTVTGSAAIAQLGAEGGLSIGSSITALLGKNGDIVAAYNAEELTDDLVGLVTSMSTGSYNTASGAAYTAKTLHILAADGQSYTIQPTSSSGASVGSLVRVTYSAAGTTVAPVQKNSLSGKVTKTSIGNKPVASDINILDVLDNTGVRVYMSRLAGMDFAGSNVYYYELNAAGEIETLILNNATGDCYSYGIVLSAEEEDTERGSSGSYTFLIDGQKSTLNTAEALRLSSGPARFTMDGNNVSAVQPLTELRNVTAVTDLTVKSAEETHTIWDHAAVYVLRNATYTTMDRSELDVNAYTIRAYYDQADAQGGRIRVIIAIPKS